MISGEGITQVESLHMERILVCTTGRILVLCSKKCAHWVESLNFLSAHQVESLHMARILKNVHKGSNPCSHLCYKSAQRVESL